MKRTLLVVLALAACIHRSHSQGEVPVNMYTGSAGIFINLYTLTDHDLSETITLSYDVNGVNLNADHSTGYGVGWSLNVGGQVSRQVRGLPDDFADATRTGWLYNSQAASIAGFGNTADLSTSTCTDEQADQSFIASLQYVKDSEPDLFSFSVGGVSGNFVFNNSGTVSLIPYQDISIVPTYSGTQGSAMTITGWTITTNNGTVYKLNQACAASKSITKNNNQTMMTLWDAEFNMYKTAVAYSSAWMLTTAQSPSGANLTYTYSGSTTNGLDNRASAFYTYSSNVSGGTSPERPKVYRLMSVSTSTTTMSIAKVTASSGVYALFSDYGLHLFDPARPTTNFKNFAFSRSNGFLISVTESGNDCYSRAPYKFFYNNMATYPLSESNKKDFWGFYNASTNLDTATSIIPTVYVYPNEAGKERYRIYPIPSYSGTQYSLTGNADRQPNPTAMTVGTLSRIVYPTGGETDLVFEPQQYYDAKAGMNQLGGGLRIKSATYYDGVNPTANITKNYSYTDANGNSTGKLISRPSFAMPLWQYVTPSTTVTYNTLASQGSAYIWSSLVAVTGNDIGNQDFTNGDATVGYTHVTVSRPSSGSATFDYYVPAVYGDAATGTGATDWLPTTMKFARPSDCPTMGIITQGETWGYPGFTNPYYDYERGLLLNKSEYNNSGTLVRNTQTTYQYIYKPRLQQPTSVVGLSYEHYANSTDQIFLYGKYAQIADVAKMVSSETVTIYDETDSSFSSTTVTQYSYGSQYHIQPTKVSKTTADGTVYGTGYSYAMDYRATGTPSDTTLRMIQQLQSGGQNALIEQVIMVLPPGGSTKVTGASLIKYRPFTYNRPLAKYQMVFRPLSPVTDFVASSVSNNAFSNDARYETVNTVNEYDNYSLPVSSTGEDRRTGGTLWGYTQRYPVASFSGVRSTGIGFSDFETTTVASFTVSNGYTGQGRTGTNGLHPYATLTRTVAKPANASTYLLAFWLKNQAGVGVTLQVTLKDATNTTTLSTASYTYIPNGNSYQYFVQPVDVTAMPSTFTVNVQGQSLLQPSGSSPALLPLLDDVAFYPDYAAISSTTYDVPFGPNSATAPSGATAYTLYDPFGRVKLVTDQDGNIRQRNTYQFSNEVQPVLVAGIQLLTTGPVYTALNHDEATPAVFQATSNDCIPGAIYEWDFGDGTTATGISPPSHVYNMIGPVTVTLTVSDPSFGQKTTTLNITIVETITVEAYGVKNGETVTLTVGDFGGTDGFPFTYEWKYSNSNTGGAWVGMGSSSTATYKLGPQSTTSFMCTITTSDGRAGNSSILTYTY